MSKIESRKGIIRKPADTIYNFLSDFRNFESLIPTDKIQNWTCTSETCSFTVMGIGRAGLKITEKTPYTFVRVNSDESTAVKFQLWTDISPVNDSSSEIRITIDPDISPIMLTMVKSQIKDFLDMLIGEIEERF